ncbi:MAG TPA: hypothetical protein VJ571_03360 [Candidatus Nitrosotalea sp.]|nr:hypothetical protein [Candidatus Nitrosotalea sp.]
MKTLHLVTLIIFMLFLIGYVDTASAQSQYDFRVWPTDGWKATGHMESIKGKICPNPVPDTNTVPSLKVYFGLPPGEAIQENRTQIVTESNTIPSCDNPVDIGTIISNATGTYPVYAVAQWMQNGIMQTVQSNTTQFLASEPCPAAYGIAPDNRLYHPGNIVSFEISPSLSGCKRLPTTMQITVYNYTGNSKSNVLYQESRQIINETWFNYTVPEWTDANGLFQFLVSETWMQGSLPDGDQQVFLSSDVNKAPKSYNLTIWPAQSSFRDDGTGTMVFLKMCPFTPPTDDNRQEKRDPSTGLITDPGSNILLESHITFPNGTKTIQQDEIPQLEDCNTGLGSLIKANAVGTWSDYDTIRWVLKNSTHQLSTKPINFTVTPAIFETKHLDEIDTKKIFAQLGAPSSQYIDLLDWSRDGKSVLFDYSNNDNLGIMSPDGKNVTRLDIPTSFGYIDRARFLPSSDSIIILAGKPDGFFLNLYKFNLGDKNLLHLTNSSTSEMINSFAVTPDGHIVYDSENTSSTGDYLGFDMWLASSNGTKIGKLYEKSFDPSVRYSQEFDGRDHFYVQDVSSDGKKILMYDTYNTGEYQDHSSIGMFDVETKTLDSGFGTFGINPRLSPSGDIVVYVRPSDGQAPGGPMELVTTDNSYQEVLNSGESVLGDFPTSFVISPDGKYILSKIQPWSYSGQRIFKIELAQPVPEFSLAVPVFLVGFVLIFIIDRRRLRK